MEFTSNKPYLLRAVYQWICDNGGTPYVVIAADYPEAQVPREFVKDGEITLNIGLAACQGLDIGNDWILFNARFSGVARSIRVPVAAVMAMFARENNQGMAFSVSMPEPKDFKKQDEQPQIESDRESKLNSKKKTEKSSHLKVIK